MPIRATFAKVCRDTRIRLRLTQEQLASAVGVSRGYVARIERGQANPTIEVVERIATALELETELVARPPIVIGSHQRDLVHARCSSYADGRLRSAGWLTVREVEIIHGRSHGWIDLLGFAPKTGVVLVVELKTRIDDAGAIERQLSWYERSAFDVVRRLGWQPRRVIGWLLLLATDEVDDALRSNRDLMARAFPNRARQMSDLLDVADPGIQGRGAALIDPHGKRRTWLIPSRIDGRRSPAPYRGYADAGRLVR
jgi:transcriptional regulator with XRE-family HTH domain